MAQRSNLVCQRKVSIPCPRQCPDISQSQDLYISRAPSLMLHDLPSQPPGLSWESQVRRPHTAAGNKAPFFDYFRSRKIKHLSAQQESGRGERRPQTARANSRRKLASVQLYSTRDNFLTAEELIHPFKYQSTVGRTPGQADMQRKLSSGSMSSRSAVPKFKMTYFNSQIVESVSARQYPSSRPLNKPLGWLLRGAAQAEGQADTEPCVEPSQAPLHCSTTSLKSQELTEEHLKQFDKDTEEQEALQDKEETSKQEQVKRAVNDLIPLLIQCY